jgi:hypothetical protein
MGRGTRVVGRRSEVGESGDDWDGWMLKWWNAGMADSSYCGAYFMINSKISSVVIALVYPFLMSPCISFLSLDHRGMT